MKKVLLLLLVSLFYQLLANAQEKNETMKTALLIIDIQEFYFPSENNVGLVNAEETSLAAKDVLDTFRTKEQLVVHVRHKSENGFAIHPNVKPLVSEKVITKTEINAFLRTDLLSYLQESNVSRLVIIGMQTQMCLEAATRAAHDFGFEVVVVGEACTTRNLEFDGNIVKAKDVHNSTLATLAGGGYAKVISLDKFKEKTNALLFEK